MKKGKCPKCKEIKYLTKHSKIGGHQKPFKRICRECHDEEHGMNPPKPKIPGKYQLGTPHRKRK